MWTSTANGWIPSWSLLLTPDRQTAWTKRKKRTAPPPTNQTTLATSWRSTATRNTSAYSDRSSQGRKPNVVRAPTTMRRRPVQANPRSPGQVPDRRQPLWRSTTNWTDWVCGWRGLWRELYLGTMFQPGLVWTP